MDLRQLVTTSRLLWRVSHPSAALPACSEEQDRTIAGLMCDLYTPPTGHELLVVAVHGVTPNGRSDHRLQRFARSLASVGVACIAPSLPRLCALQWIPSDVERLAALIHALRASHARVGIIGFSFGGSYALTAAASEACRGEVDFAITIGAYHSLAEVFEYLLAARDRRPATPAAWGGWAYLQLVLAARHAAALALPDGLRVEVERRLRGHCAEEAADANRAFCEEQLAALELVRYEHEHRDEQALAAVSPAGRLAGLQCPVGILHDPADPLVPVAHAHELCAELSRRRQGRQQLLVTSLLQHVRFSGVLDLRELWRLHQMMAPLVGSHPPAV